MGAIDDQASFAILTEGVSAARLGIYRLQKKIDRALQLVQSSNQKEHLYEVAGDIISSVPSEVDRIARELDRTIYALSVLEQKQLRDRLPFADRKKVDDLTDRVAHRVLERYQKQADLNPALGDPYVSGPCLVMQRIRDSVPNKAQQEALIDDVEAGLKLTNTDAAKIYDIETDRGVGRFKQLVLTAHAQYRMDQRGISVPAVRAALTSFLQAWSVQKSQRTPLWQSWERDMSSSREIEWMDPKTHLFIVFVVHKEQVGLVTAYWKGDSDPKPQSESSCPIV